MATRWGREGDLAALPMQPRQREDCERPIRAKVYGLICLAQARRNRKLDVCFLTASVAIVLGGLGLAAHAAAKSSMDVFVQKLS